MRRGLLASVLVLALAPAGAQASDHFNSKPYRDKVTVRNMLKHERALQDIADANNGTRAAGTSGNEATVDYVASTMKKAGWTVRKQPFTFPFFEEPQPATFEQTAPTATTFTENTDYALMTFSGSGDVTAPVVPVDVVVPIGANPANTSTSWCEATDFNGFPEGAIALVQRGTCTFGTKAQKAEAAHASAVVVFNEGQAPDRTDVVAGTLGAPVGIPAIGISYAMGEQTVQAIRAGQTVTWHLATHTVNEERTTFNVIADAPFGDRDRTVVVSAHNDSVLAGPGINDDGSGTSMDLELARQLGHSGRKPRNHLRFIWVGAEELGLLGSQFYVDSLSDAERSQIVAMLDFDMVASPNFARQVYDGDGSTFGADLSGPDGSGFIESLFTGFFDSRRQAHEPIPFDGRSDYVAFTNAGIPAGGIFTGAEKIKTPEEQALFGGTAGQPLDPCYHQACDTFANLNLTAFEQMKNAAADAVLTLGQIQGPIVNGRSIGDDGRGHHSGGKHIGRGAFRGESARR